MTAEIFGRADRAGPRPRRAHAPVRPGDPLLLLGHHRRGATRPRLGQAFAFQRQGSDRVAVAVTGEGAANQGAFHESLNLAALWKLPVVFVDRGQRLGDLGAPGGVHGHQLQRGPGRRLRHPRRADRGQRRRGRVRGGRTRRSARARRRRRADPDRGPHPAAVGPLRGRRPGLPRPTWPRSRPRPDPGVRGAAADAGDPGRRGRRRASRTRRRPGSRTAIDFAKASPVPDPATAARVRLRLKEDADDHH